MSVYQKLLTWMSGGRGQGDPEMGISVFGEFREIELYGEIFKHLDVENLKICKRVCRAWAAGMSASRVLRQQSVTEWDKNNFDDSILMRLQFYFNRVQIFTQQLRLINYGENIQTELMPYLTQLNGLQFVTGLEIVKCQMTLQNLTSIVAELPALVTLIVTDVRLDSNLARTGPNPHWRNPRMPRIEYDEPEDANPGWLKLRTLKMKNTEVLTYQNYTIAFLDYNDPKPTSTSIVSNYCPNLEHLDFHLSNFRSYSLSCYDESFTNFFRTLRKSSKTLKSVALETFRIDIEREYWEEHYQEQAHENQYDFTEFVRHLKIFTLRNEASSLKLTKLNLCFQLVQLELIEARTAFFPFLQTQTTLKEFSLSHVYLPGGGQQTILEFLDSLPPDCYIQLEGVMGVRREIPQNIQNMFQFPQGPPLNHIPIEGVGFIRTRNRYLDAPIQGYFDSVIHLNTAVLSLTLRFVCCNSLADIDVFDRNIRSLTKIKIQQSGARLQHKIALGDQDIQRIITTATRLTDLWLDFCNLEAITDFGLTGIDPGACARMSLARNFELQDGDMAGSPISTLKKLRSLNLSTIGDHVTDVTAHHAFKGLNSLSTFGISKPMITSSGYRELRRLFQFNQVVQFGPHTKFQFDRLDSADW